MDATFKTSVQDLVLAGLGLVILHQVGGGGAQSVLGACDVTRKMNCGRN